MKKIAYLFIFIGCFAHAQKGIITVINSQNSNLVSRVSAIQDTEAPTAPSSLSVSTIMQTSVVLNWTASTDNVGVVQYALYNGSDSFVQTLTGTSETVIGLTSETLYSNYYIRAQDAAGNFSTGSNTVSFTTLAEETGNTYTLSEAKKVSIGVYTANDILLRTLTQYEDKTAGTYNVPSWDGLDEEGNDVTARADHYKVVANNLQANWDGVIGNTSDSFTGQSVWARFNLVQDIAIVGNDVYCAFGYSEGHASLAKFNKTDKHKLIELQTTRIVSPSFSKLASDGTYLYMAGGNTMPTGEGRYTFFAKSTFANIGKYNYWEDMGDTYQLYSSTFKVGNKIIEATEEYSLPAVPTGLAVQQNNENLYLAREFRNTLTIINKNTGAIKSTQTYTKPKHCRIDINGDFWMVHGDTTETIEKYTINNTTGLLTSTGFTITGFVNIQGMDISPDGNTVVVNEAATYDQTFGYSTSTGSLLWTLGRAESYIDDSRVYNDKFLFTDIDEVQYEYAYVKYDTDGSLWIDDKGNQRQLIFDASRNYVDQIAYIQAFYNTSVDNVDNTRVFGGWFEYEVDYTKPLLRDGGANGSWRLSHNWSPMQNLDQLLYASNTTQLGDVVTLSNGRTYAAMPDLATGANGANIRFWELVTNGGLRDTGAVVSSSGAEIVRADDVYERETRSGGFARINTRPITFDGSNNPVFGSESQIESWDESEIYQSRGISGQYTANGIRTVFFGNEGVAGQYHIAGYDITDNEFKWKAFPGVVYGTNDDYPLETGTFDIRTTVQKFAEGGWTVDDMVFFIYHGEFWRNIQTNYTHVLHQSGLPLIDFGTDGVDRLSYSDSKAGMAGNSFGSSFAKVGNSIYMYQNDESWHSGIHRWRIDNIDSITELNITIE